MNVSDAVQVAISDTEKLFESEGITNLGLEEVAFDDNSEEWVVTVGFSRPWDYPSTGTLSAGALAAALGTQMVRPERQMVRPERSFKIVRVKDSDGRVVSVKNYATGSID